MDHDHFHSNDGPASAGFCMSDTTQKAKQIKHQYEKSWMSLKEVRAVGVGYLSDSRKVGIVVSVSGNPEKIRKRIPVEVEGVPVEIQQTGEFRAQ